MDRFIHSLGVGVAVGATAHLGEGGSSGAFALVAGAAGFLATTALLSVGFETPVRRFSPVFGDSVWRRHREFVMACVAILTVAVLVTDSRWRGEAPQLYWWIEAIGLLLIAVGVLGQNLVEYRARDNTPSAVYFACAGATGAGAQSGGVLLATVAGLAGMAIYRAAPLRPNTENIIFLDTSSPAARSVGLPRFSHRVQVGCLLLGAVAVADLAEWLQSVGYLPILVRLP
jgi:hypothetical protein